ncbi:hypothetical protein KsCSTR_16340 [Candidatus Kuenenia stuttgartiensis]|uniref:Uncharacterized protein n=1 Tax=Kuenenia stuttgartiensis TaxID=174633 RepID=Q1Q1V6_KUEST|nr:hypothetical protein KsCSTR_16340 [Candidatus Kuenenia stuttgartiensis]CAJ73984.1 unknown protein [Candidatus Kuenenia stuttgartiensis]
MSVDTGADSCAYSCIFVFIRGKNNPCLICFLLRSLRPPISMRAGFCGAVIIKYGV